MTDGVRTGPLIGYVPGAFDLFHVGHLNVLRQAREQCDVLVAGVVADDVLERTKGDRPFVPLEERLAIVDALRFVDWTYAERTEDKLDAWRVVGFHRLFKGDDWKGTDRGRALEAVLRPHGVEVVYFPYTVHTSSTQLRGLITADRSAS
jgi:glycerol-3-phosphate cytidylyltransferase